MTNLCKTYSMTIGLINFVLVICSFIMKNSLVEVGFKEIELSLLEQTINSDVYIEQLTKLNNAVEEKRHKLTNMEI